MLSVKMILWPVKSSWRCSQIAVLLCFSETLKICQQGEQYVGTVLLLWRKDKFVSLFVVHSMLRSHWYVQKLASAFRAITCWPYVDCLQLEILTHWIYNIDRFHLNLLNYLWILLLIRNTTEPKIWGILMTDMERNALNFWNVRGCWGMFLSRCVQ